MRQKIFTFLSGFLLITLLLIQASCSDDTPVEKKPDAVSNSISFSGGSIPNPVLTSENGTVSVTFTSSDPWSVSVEPTRNGIEWLTITPQSGEAGESTITIKADDNKDYQERNAKVKIKTASAEKIFTVTQKQQNALITSSDKIEVGEEGGDISVDFKTNINFTTDIEPAARSWISIRETRGLTDHSLILSISPNEDEQPRSGTVTIYGENISESVTVYQAGSKPQLILYDTEKTIGSNGGSFSIQLKSNTEYDIRLPKEDWIREETTRAFSSYTHYFTVDPNYGYDPREAEIRFINRENGELSVCHVYQLQYEAIAVAKNSYYVKGKGDRLDFVVSVNTDFDVKIEGDWISQIFDNDTRGMREEQLSFSIAPRTDVEERVATRHGSITLTTRHNGKSQKIEVEQGPYEEPELVNVTYRRDYEWLEAEYNLPLRACLIVYRDREYSNGVITTDTFYSGNCAMEYGIEAMTIHSSNETECELGEGEMVYYKTSPSYIDDYNMKRYYSTCIPNIDLISTRKCRDELTYPNCFEKRNYILMGTQDRFDPENPKNGWYFNVISYCQWYALEYNVHIPRMYSMFIRWYDRFFYDNGTIIEFDDWRATQDFKFTQTPIPANGNRGRSILNVMECREKFLGKEFYYSITDTVYEPASRSIK